GGVGGGGGVGRREAGWQVLGGGRSAADGDALGGGGIEPIELDVTDPEQITAAAMAVGPTLDGLVANAGIAVAAPLELVPLDELRRQLEINGVGQVAVVQAVLPALRQAAGRGVFMGSV